MDADPKNFKPSYAVTDDVAHNRYAYVPVLRGIGRYSKTVYALHGKRRASAESAIKYARRVYLRWKDLREAA